MAWWNALYLSITYTILFFIYIFFIFLMFTEFLFIVAAKWKQHKYLLTGE